MTPISVLHLCHRTENALAAEDIQTVEALVEKSDVEILKFVGIGPSSIREISDSLANRGLALLGMTPRSPEATLRDYFAGKALRCLVIDLTDIHGAASAAYQIADAMLVARNHSTDYARIGAE